MTYEKYLKLSIVIRLLIVVALVFVQSAASTWLVVGKIVPYLSGIEGMTMLGMFNSGMLYSLLLIGACALLDWGVFKLYNRHVEKKEHELLMKEIYETDKEKAEGSR
jgi:hypothetical protein